MDIRLADRPQHPLPQPQSQSQVAHVHPPMVYVYERQQWEYEVTVQTGMSEQELNALGTGGWELVGLAALPETTQFYFK